MGVWYGHCGGGMWDGRPSGCGLWWGGVNVMLSGMVMGHMEGEGSLHLGSSKQISHSE